MFCIVYIIITNVLNPYTLKFSKSHPFKCMNLIICFAELELMWHQFKGELREKGYD